MPPLRPHLQVRAAAAHAASGPPRSRLLAGAAGLFLLVLASACDGSSSGDARAPGFVGVVPPGGSSRGGVLATLVGTGFEEPGAGTTTVSFGGRQATSVQVVHDTTITCAAPPGRPGTSVDVVLTNAFGSVTLPRAYQYFPRPTVVDCTPDKGSALGGDLVTLTGSGFADNLAGTNEVLFDGVPATDVVVIDDRSLSCVTPAGSPGATIDVLVRNANGSATLRDAFRYQAVPSPHTRGSSPGGDGSLAEVVAEELPSVRPGPDARFLRVTGSDAADGCSPATAWGTLQHALDRLRPGETLFVGGGVHAAGARLATAGAPGRPLTVRGDPAGEHTGDAGAPVLDARGASSALELVRPAQLVVEGLRLQGAAGPGLRVLDPCGALLLRDLELTANGVGLRVEGGHGVLLESSRVHANHGGGVLLEDTREATLRNDVVRANGGHGVELRGGSLDARNNAVHANGGHGIFVGTGARARLTANVVSDQRGAGLVAPGDARSERNLIGGNAAGDWVGLAPGPGDRRGRPDWDGTEEPPLLGDGPLGRAASDARGAAEEADAVLLSDGTRMGDRTTRADDGLDTGETDPGVHAAVRPDPIGPLARGDALLVALDRGPDGAAARRPLLRTWGAADGTWSAPLRGLPAGARAPHAAWVEHASAPEGQLLAFASAGTHEADGRLDLQRWNGRRWESTPPRPLGLLPQADHRPFDLAVERRSGEALLVHADAAGRPAFATRVGGRWSDSRPLPLASVRAPDADPGGADALRWVELEAAPSGDAIALAIEDGQGRLTLFIWDGEHWDAASTSSLTTSLVGPPRASAVRPRAFDLAFEPTGGALLVVWGDAGAGATLCARRRPADGGWERGTLAPGLGAAGFVELEPVPGGRAGGDAPHVGCVTWHPGPRGATLVASVRDARTGRWDAERRPDAAPLAAHDPAAVAWRGRELLVAFTTPAPGRLERLAWSPDGGWRSRPPLLLAGMGPPRSVRLLAGGEAELSLAIDAAGALFGDPSPDGAPLVPALGDGRTLALAVGPAAGLPPFPEGP